jgi:hypothetical protein
MSRHFLAFDVELDIGQRLRFKQLTQLLQDDLLSVDGRLSQADEQLESRTVDLVTPGCVVPQRAERVRPRYRAPLALARLSHFFAFRNVQISRHFTNGVLCDFTNNQK